MDGINSELLKNPKLAQKALENHAVIEKVKVEGDHHIQKTKVERGVLGNIWGNPESVPNNIAALSVVLLLLAGLLYTFLLPTLNLSTDLPAKDFWAIILPFMSLCIGYLFGKKKSEES